MMAEDVRYGFTMLIKCIMLFTAISSLNGSCPDTSGGTVSWWILYQQKAMPFFHFYVDNRDNNNVTLHYPERHDSVLARAIAKITDGSLDQYFVYINDFLKLRSISQEFGYLSSLKWMNGILAMDKSWSSGYWLIHNNIQFPVIREKVLVGADDNLWYPTTVGDSSDNVFYICLSADNGTHLTQLLSSILAGNPIIYKKNINEDILKIPFFQGTGMTDSTFALQGSAMVFMNCLYSSNEESLDKCLFKYSMHGRTSISVVTRSRGMIKRTRGICYNKESMHLYDFMSLSDSGYVSEDFFSTPTMFALSDDFKTSTYGTTCFGQDVAAYTDIVAIMVCVDLPILHNDLLKSSSVTNWACPSTTLGISNIISTDSFQHDVVSDSYSKAQNQMSVSKLSTKIQSKWDTTSRKKRDTHSISQENSNSESTNNNEAANEESEQNLKMKDDDENAIMTNSVWKNPLVKNEKLYKRYMKMVRDMNEVLVLPPHTKETNLTRKAWKPVNAKRVNTKDELDSFLSKNANHVLALFCQAHCRYCNVVEEFFDGLRTDITSSDIDIIVVDATVVKDDSTLAVTFIPFVRYKPKMVDSWIDFDENEFEVFPLTSFLYHRLISKTVSPKIQTTNLIPTPSRNRRAVNEIGAKETFHKKKEEIHLRPKRAVHYEFFIKHLPFMNPDDNKKVDSLVEKFKSISLLLPESKRRLNDFIMTRNSEEHINVTKNLQNLVNQMLLAAECSNDNLTNKKFKRFYFESKICKNINLNKLGNKLHVAFIRMQNKTFECKYYTEGSLDIGVGILHDNITAEDQLLDAENELKNKAHNLSKEIERINEMISKETKNKKKENKEKLKIDREKKLSTLNTKCEVYESYKNVDSNNEYQRFMIDHLESFNREGNGIDCEE